ncbi:conserved hypothetical protein [Gammaproteobacteria bacterium]
MATRAFNGSGPLPKIHYIAFGDGGHNPDLSIIPANANATGLYHELLRKPLETLIQEDVYSVTGLGVVENSELVGLRISEAALFDANGAIVGIKTFSPKFKESDERYEISIKIRF